jgi:PKD domain
VRFRSLAGAVTAVAGLTLASMAAAPGALSATRAEHVAGTQTVRALSGDVSFTINTYYDPSLTGQSVELDVDATSSCAITDYTWNFGDGGASSGASSSISHTWQHRGSYQVTLTVTDSCGYSNTGSYTQDVWPDLAPTIAVSITKSHGTVYADPSATTDDDGGVPNPTGPYYYEWSWGDGNWSDSYAYSNGGLASHAYAHSGTYTITVYAYDTAYNYSSSTSTVSVGPSPRTTFRIENTGAAVRYHGSWTTTLCRQLRCSPNGTQTASSTRGDRAVVHFTGRGIAWIATKGPHGGKARVYLDGVLIGKVNLYRSRPLHGVAVYTSPSLTRGPHKLAVKLVHSKRVNIDDFRVTR